MSSEEKKLISKLAAELEEQKIAVKNQSDAKVQSYKTKSLEQNVERLKPLEAKKLEEMEKILQKTKEKEAQISDARWAEEQKFQQEQNQIRVNDQAAVEKELDDTKFHYEQELEKSADRNNEMEKKTIETEKALNEIYVAHSSEETSDKNKMEEFKSQLTKDIIELETRHITESLENTNKQLEERAKVVANINEKQETIFDKAVQHREQLAAGNLDSLLSIATISLLDIDSAKIEAVNTSINKAKVQKNEMQRSYNEILVYLTAMDRNRTSVGQNKIHNVKLTESRLRILSNQLGSISSGLDDVGFKNARIEELNKLSEDIKKIHEEIGTAKDCISYFRSFLAEKRTNWEDGKFDEFMEIISSITTGIDSLLLLTNVKKHEQTKLLSNQVKSLGSKKSNTLE